MSVMAGLRKWRTYDAPESYTAARSIALRLRASSVESRCTPPSSIFRTVSCIDIDRRRAADKVTHSLL